MLWGPGVLQEPPSCSQPGTSSLSPTGRLPAHSIRNGGRVGRTVRGSHQPRPTSLVLQRLPVCTPGLLVRLDCIQRQEGKWTCSLRRFKCV